MKKILNIKSLIVIIVLFLPIFVLADGSLDDPPYNPDAPIDGGLSLLIAAGIGYGVKKIKEKKQQKDTNVLDK